MNRLRRLLVPALLASALLTALAFAATASAEVRAGESTSPENPAIPAKGDILAATARYDSTSGATTFSMTTREAPGEKPELATYAVLGRPKEGVCGLNPTLSPEPLLPVMEIIAQGTPAGMTIVESPSSWIEIGEDMKIDGLGLASRSVDGATTTLSATSSELVNKPYSCATVVTQTSPEFPLNPEKEEVKAAETLDEVSFLLNALPEPPAAPKPQPPAPAALSFAKSKPVTAKLGKWTKVKVKVANTGGTTVGPIAFKAKAPAGVIVKPGSPKLPALLGGQTWTIDLQVKLTEKAKSKSTITLAGTSGSLTAAGSVVVKSTAG